MGTHKFIFFLIITGCENLFVVSPIYKTVWEKYGVINSDLYKRCENNVTASCPLVHVHINGFYFGHPENNEYVNLFYHMEYILILMYTNVHKWYTF